MAQSGATAPLLESRWTHMAFIGTKIQSLTQYLHISNWFMQFYPPFSSFFSTFGVKAANGINKMFKFSPYNVSFLKSSGAGVCHFFSKIFGVQIKKWQKKKYPAKENREQEYPLSLQNRTTESDEGICRRVWRRQCVPYEGHIVLPNKQKRTPANPACHWLMTTVSGTKKRSWLLYQYNK